MIAQRMNDTGRQCTIRDGITKNDSPKNATTSNGITMKGHKGTTIELKTQ
jgi:hypothetical protein